MRFTKTELATKNIKIKGRKFGKTANESNVTKNLKEFRKVTKSAVMCHYYGTK